MGRDAQLNSMFRVANDAADMLIDETARRTAALQRRMQQTVRRSSVSDKRELPAEAPNNLKLFLERFRERQRHLEQDANSIFVLPSVQTVGEYEATIEEVEEIVHKRSLGYSEDVPLPNDTDLGRHRRDDPLFLAHWKPGITRIPRSPGASRRSPRK